MLRPLPPTRANSQSAHFAKQSHRNPKFASRGTDGKNASFRPNCETKMGAVTFFPPFTKSEVQNWEEEEGIPIHICFLWNRSRGRRKEAWQWKKLGGICLAGIIILSKERGRGGIGKERRRKLFLGNFLLSFSFYSSDRSGGKTFTRPLKKKKEVEEEGQ